jgi:BirA family transcriptional regulator, biotin operon repressor / biotin---[acetyl-CoA-carboxylase] ligase
VRNEILDLLGNRQGTFLSGESISQDLNITRAAVWKQIQALKDIGYDIEAQTKRGYRLIKGPSSLDEWALKMELKTDLLGKSIRLFDELPSTNDWAKDLVRQGGEHGLVVLAKRQTLGRGRMQRIWESPAGGLWMSVLIKPKLNLADAAKLTLSTGVALAKAFRALYGLEVGIKWPNDLVYKGEKIAGILGEVAGEWNTVQTLILGIGVNANLKRKELSSEFAATTLYELLGYEVNLNQLGAAILLELEKEVLALEHGDAQGLRDRWMFYAVGVGNLVTVERAGEVYKGIFQGIHENGELILNQDGKELYFSSGEVKFRSGMGNNYSN